MSDGHNDNSGEELAEDIADAAPPDSSIGGASRLLPFDAVTTDPEPDSSTIPEDDSSEPGISAGMISAAADPPMTPPSENEIRRWRDEQETQPNWKAKRWDFLVELPAVNRWLLSTGSGLIVLALLRLTVPPVYSSTASAIHPYTAEGKRETCQSHLQQLAQSMALYRQDNDDSYPALDNGGSGDKRRTWVSSVRESVLLNSYSFGCPTGPGEEWYVSSYGLNPILAGGSGSVKQSDVVNPEQTMLLADRGEQHDVALLPGLTGWHAPTAEPEGVASGNLSFRHSESASVLFTDGHAEAKSTGEWLKTSAPWGGALAMRQSVKRLEQRHPLLRQVDNFLFAGDEKRALTNLKYNRTKAKAALPQVLSLWKENRGGNDENGSLAVEKWGWQIAQLWKKCGQGEMLQEMDREQSARSQAVLQAVDIGDWKKQETDLGFSIDSPSGWTVETKVDGRYRNTFFRSSSPYIFALVERGERAKPGPEKGIDWTGMHRDYRRIHGNRYRLIRMGTEQLGGQQASVWEFELERTGEPALRKIYVGRSQVWYSYVFVWTAPKTDFVGSLNEYNRVQASFSFQ